jgi:hypothetical protein
MQILRHLGEVKRNELIYAGLAKVIPGLPADVIAAANSLYIAVTEGRNIDMAVFNTLGLASGLLADGNVLSCLAAYIRDTVLDYAGDSYAGQFLGSDDQHPAAYLFTGLAALAIAARYWMTDEGAPQRRLLRVSVSAADLLIWVNGCWNQLVRLARRAPAMPGLPEQSAPSAVDVESRTDVVYGDREQSLHGPRNDAYVGDLAGGGMRVAAFHANTTVRPEGLARVTVAPAPQGSSDKGTCDIAMALHRSAMREAMALDGVTGLSHCDVREEHAWQKQGSRWLLTSDIRTRCHATGRPLPDRQEAAPPFGAPHHAAARVDQAGTAFHPRRNERAPPANGLRADAAGAAVIGPEPAAWYARPWLPVASADSTVPDITRFTLVPTSSERSATDPYRERANAQVFRMLQKHKRSPTVGDVETYVTEVLALARKDRATKERLAKAILRGQGGERVGPGKTLDSQVLNDTIRDWLKANGLEKYADRFNDAELRVHQQNHAIRRLLERTDDKGVTLGDKASLLTHAALFVRSSPSHAERFARCLRRSQGATGAGRHPPLSEAVVKDTIYEWLIANAWGLYIGAFSPDVPPRSERGFTKEDEAIVGVLKQYAYRPDGPTVPSLVTQIMHFSQEDPAGKERVVRTILQVRGEFGGRAHETLDPHFRDSVFDDYLTHKLFGSDLGTFLAKAAARQEGPDGVALKEITRLLSSEVYGWGRFPLPVSDAIWDQIVTKKLPVVARHRLGSVLDQTEAVPSVPFEWDDINAGLMLAASMGKDMNVFTLEEASALGQMLYALIKEGAADPALISYWALPAMAYPAQGASATLGSANRLDQEEVALNAYLAAKEAYLKENDPVETFNRLAASFDKAYRDYKTRPQLAQDILDKKCPDQSQALAGYLLAGHLRCRMKDAEGKRIVLPAIDDVFAEQNKKIADLYEQLDIVPVTQAWKALSDDELIFLNDAEIRRVTAFAKYTGLLWPGHPSSYAQLPKQATPVELDIELFAARHDGVERIYALQMKDGAYHMSREDQGSSFYSKRVLDQGAFRNRGDFDIGFSDDGGTVKERSKPLSDLVPVMAKKHRDLFFEQLHEQGYEKTGLQQAQEVLLSLIPFYSGIKAATDGRVAESVNSLAMDALSFAVPVGMVARQLSRAAVKLLIGGGAAARQALNLAASGAAFKEVLKQAAGNFDRYGIKPAGGVFSRKQLIAIGMETLRAMDPGIEPLARVGQAGAKRFVSLGKSLAAKSKADTLSAALAKLDGAAENLPASAAADVYARQPGIDRSIPMLRLGGDKHQGKDIYLKLDPATGEVYGRKYTLTHDNVLEPVPQDMAHRLKNILDKGLSGRGQALPGDIPRDVLGSWPAKHESGMTLSEFAKETGIKRNVLRKYITANGELNYFGKCLVDGQIPMVRRIEPDHLVAWVLEHHATSGFRRSMFDFAAENGILYDTFKVCALRGGDLTDIGKEFFKTAVMNARMLDVYERNYRTTMSGSRYAFSLLSEITPSAINSVINEDGSLTVLGLNYRMERYRSGINFVLKMPVADLNDYALAADLDAAILRKYVTDDRVLTAEGDRLFGAPGAGGSEYGERRKPVILGNQELAGLHPDLNVQETKPSKMRLHHDIVAVNADRKLDPSNVFDAIFSGPALPEFGGKDVKKVINNHYEVGRNIMGGVLEKAYESSTTFRRLFNHAYENELRFPANRWLLDVMSNAGASWERGRKFVAMGFDISMNNYHADGVLARSSVQRILMHEIIHAMTYFTDYELMNSRGPIVEYTNIILKEMGLTDVARTKY